MATNGCIKREGYSVSFSALIKMFDSDLDSNKKIFFQIFWLNFCFLGFSKGVRLSNVIYNFLTVFWHLRL